MSRDDSIEEWRKQIDALDGELFDALGRRMEVIRAIGGYKKAHGLELRDQQRLKALLDAQLSRAESLNLPKEFITELYELIHKFALEIEAEA